MYCVQALTVELLLLFIKREKQEHFEQIRFLNKWKQFLTDSSFSSMSIMINLLAYDKAITLNHNNVNSVFWLTNKKTVYLLNKVENNITFTKKEISFVSKSSNKLDNRLKWMLEQMQQSEINKKM